MIAIPIHAANPGYMTGSGNWTYLIPGPDSLLIDAGVGKAEHLDAIASHAPGGPARVLVTHGHSDHASGAPAIAQRWPEARFLKYPWAERDAVYTAPWQFVGDGDRLSTSQGELQLLLTPGHAPDHLALWHAASRTVFTGDLLVKGNTVVIPGSHGGSLIAYLRSLDRVRALKPVRALPAHGEVIEDPDALIQQYIDHRVVREKQIVAALQGEPATVDSIVAAIYGGLRQELTPMAVQTVVAHLHKLEHDGLALREDDRWALVGRVDE